MAHAALAILLLFAACVSHLSARAIDLRNPLPHARGDPSNASLPMKAITAKRLSLRLAGSTNNTAGHKDNPLPWGEVASAKAEAMRQYLGNASKRVLMNPINVFRAALCTSRPNTFKHRKCMKFMFKHCKKQTTQQGHCEKFFKVLIDGCAEHHNDNPESKKACAWVNDYVADNAADAQEDEDDEEEEEEVGTPAEEDEETKELEDEVGVHPEKDETEEEHGDTEVTEDVEEKEESLDSGVEATDEEADEEEKEEAEADEAAEGTDANGDTPPEEADEGEKAEIAEDAGEAVKDEGEETEEEATASAPAAAAEATLESPKAPAPAPQAAPAAGPGGIVLGIDKKAKPLPEQGYNDFGHPLVGPYEDGEHHSKDWRKEWPQAHGDYDDSVMAACKKNPKLQWCKLYMKAGPP